MEEGEWTTEKEGLGVGCQHEGMEFEMVLFSFFSCVQCFTGHGPDESGVGLTFCSRRLEGSRLSTAVKRHETTAKATSIGGSPGSSMVIVMLPFFLPCGTCFLFPGDHTFVLFVGYVIAGR